MSGFTRSDPIIPVNKLTDVHQALRKLMRLHGGRLVLVHATHATIPQAETPLPGIPRDSPVSAGSSEKMFIHPRKCVYVHKNGCSTLSESLEAKFHLVWLLRHHNHKTPSEPGASFVKCQYSTCEAQTWIGAWHVIVMYLCEP